MACAGKGLGARCTGPPTRRCARCGAVAYFSVSHQIWHWDVHKEECERLEEMEQIDTLNEFPFTFSEEATVQVCEKQETKRGVHQTGMWLYECSCGEPVMSFDCSRLNNTWDLASTLCPCNDSIKSIQTTDRGRKHRSLHPLLLKLLPLWNAQMVCVNLHIRVCCVSLSKDCRVEVSLLRLNVMASSTPL